MPKFKKKMQTTAKDGSDLALADPVFVNYGSDAYVKFSVDDAGSLNLTCSAEHDLAIVRGGGGFEVKLLKK